MGILGQNQKRAVPVMIRNIGGAPLTITGPVTVIPVNCTATVRDAAPSLVAAGDTALVMILVQAGASGNPSVLVSIPSNDADENPFTFTMNWQFTRPNTVIRFEQGEAFCHVFPARRGELEKIMPEVRPIADEPELKAAFDAWTASRANFLDGLRKPDSEASAAKWQKHYYRGQNLDGTGIAADDHRTKIRLQPFRKSEESDGG